MSLPTKVQLQEGMEASFSMEEKVVKVVDIQVTTTNIITEEKLKLVMKVKILTKNPNVIIVRIMTI